MKNIQRRSKSLVEDSQFINESRNSLPSQRMDLPRPLKTPIAFHEESTTVPPPNRFTLTQGDTRIAQIVAQSLGEKNLKGEGPMNHSNLFGEAPFFPP